MTSDTLSSAGIAAWTSSSVSSVPHRSGHRWPLLQGQRSLVGSGLQLRMLLRYASRKLPGLAMGMHSYRG